MIKVGITGGIGSGKTVVTQIFRVMGYPVYIADTESKRLTESSTSIRDQLIDFFGEEIYNGYSLNKPLLASYIFSDKSLLTQVNNIIHPVVLNDFELWAIQQKSKLVILESAILFESGFNKKVDNSLMVYAPEKIRIERVWKRDGLNKEEIMKRIQNQLSDEEKCKLASYIIYNTDHKALIPQIITLMKKLVI